MAEPNIDEPTFDIMIPNRDGEMYIFENLLARDFIVKKWADQPELWADVEYPDDRELYQLSQDWYENNNIEGIVGSTWEEVKGDDWLAWESHPGVKFGTPLRIYRVRLARGRRHIKTIYRND